MKMKISVASAEAVIADREPGQKTRRQMVDEDQPQREAAEQIEPELALADGRQRNSRRGRARPGTCRLGLHRLGGSRDRRSRHLVGNGHRGLKTLPQNRDLVRRGKECTGPAVISQSDRITCKYTCKYT
ncbi:hypothetical protein ACVWYI_001126 [Bradyrhizobium sp. LB13.1]